MNILYLYSLNKKYFCVLKLYRLLSGNFIKLFFVLGLLGSLTLSTTLESMSLLTEHSFEIENIDWQEDSSEEIDDKKEDKKIQNYFSVASSSLNLINKATHKFSLQLSPNIYLEIHNPPPELS